MKRILKYLGYFSAVAGAVATVYYIGVFFANIQSDIKQVVNTVSEIKTEQTDQSEKIKSIEYEVKDISSLQVKQGSFNNAIDRSYRDHLKKSKDLIDEYTKYLEMQIEKQETLKKNDDSTVEDKTEKRESKIGIYKTEK
jgi:hypothetical protein